MLRFSFTIAALSLMVAVCQAAPISKVDVDLSKITAIKIGPGRISVIQFPEAIAEAKVGAPDKLRAATSQSDERELTLFWISSGASKSNLIVRTVKRTYVFDIEPSVSGHQDLILVGNVSGGPERQAPKRQIGELSRSKKKPIYEVELK